MTFTVWGPTAKPQLHLRRKPARTMSSGLTTVATSGLPLTTSLLSMISFNATSLRSSVARRIFLIFLLCAFLPFGTLVLVSYHQVEKFFSQRSQRQLREMAKLFGMDVFQRLRLLESSLRLMAS